MHNAAKKQILVLVEGEKTDVFVMQNLFRVYSELDSDYIIVPYRTNIYVLYQEFFAGSDDQDDLDLLQVLKAREPNPERKLMFDEKYTDILLIFDFDPQDPGFTEEKICKMQAYFSESSDMGKLYINYPMVEAFYHMPCIPDPDYCSRTTRVDELIQRTYKSRVHVESRGGDYRKFAVTRTDYNYVILENIRKARALLNISADVPETWEEIDLQGILVKQLSSLQQGYVHVLCTCVIYIYDYNSQWLLQD